MAVLKPYSCANAGTKEESNRLGVRKKSEQPPYSEFNHNQHNSIQRCFEISLSTR